MMAAASCSVGIIPFHRPRLPYLDRSSYSPASDPVGSPHLSHVNVSSLAWVASASSRYPTLARKRIAPIEILSGKFYLEFCFMPRPGARFSLFYFTHRLPDVPLIYVPCRTLNSARNIAAGKIKSRCEETCNICILRSVKSGTGYKADRKN